MAKRIQFRRGTEIEWSTSNPILDIGEVGVNLTNLTYKIGDAITAWNSLPQEEIPDLITGLNLPETSGILPSSGYLNLYNSEVAERHLPTFIDPNDLIKHIQPNLLGNGSYLVLPGTTTSMNTIGGPALTIVGTGSHPTLSGTNIVTQTSRMALISASGINSAAEIRAAFARSWRGDKDDLGGFLFRSKFAVTITTTGSQFYAGMLGSTSATATTTTPSALTNLIAVGYDAADTNYQIMYNDGTGVSNKIDTGLPKNEYQSLYEINFFVPPNVDQTIHYSFSDLSSSGTTVTGTIISYDIPASTQFLAPHIFLSNGGGGEALGAELQIVRMYIESDY